MRRLFGKAKIKTDSRWLDKQALAAPSRFYGDGGTVHSSGVLDVEIHDGRVVAVWYRCQQLPYQVTTVSPERSAEMDEMHSNQDWPKITGVELLDWSESGDSGGLTI